MFGFNIGAPEIMIIGFIALLFFGNRVPSMMRSLGRGVTEFKQGISGIQDEIRQVEDKTLTS